MRRQSIIVACAAWLALPLSIGCWGSDPTYNKHDFAAAAAEVRCSWVFDCCDEGEQEDWITDNKASCVAEITANYSAYYRDADAEQWDGQAAVSCVDNLNEKAHSCPRSFDPDAEIDSCVLVAPTKGPGDMCANRWECTTKFCKNGVCANPLTEGSVCTQDEPCTDGLRCISGTCRPLQPNGAKCTEGKECMSGACGGYRCEAGTTTYTCDGR